MRIPRNFSRHFRTNLDRKFIIRKKNCKSWYVITFDYTDKVLIVLSATSGGVSIISFTSVVGTLKIFILAKSKPNSIEALVFQALIGTKS